MSEVNTDGVEPMWTPLEDKYTLRVRADHVPGDDIHERPFRLQTLTVDNS